MDFGVLASNEMALPGPELLAKSFLDSALALESSPSLLGISRQSQAGVKGAFKELLSTLDAETNFDTSTGEMTWREPSRVSETFTRPFAATILADSVETLAEDSTQDPVTGVSTTAQLVGAASATINFQPSGAAVPTGYTADTGRAYDATRGYGWVRQDSLRSTTHVPLDISPNTRDRNRVADQRLDTLILMQDNNTSNPSGVKTPAAWEYKLNNGSYNVTVSVGDPAYFDSQHTIRVEGVKAINLFKPSSTQRFKQTTVLANVTDGKLTIDAIGGTNTKLNYVDIASANPNFTAINWSTVAPSPIGRSEGPGAIANGKLYAFGGYINTTYTPASRSDAYNPANNTWTRIKDLPKGLTHAGTAVDGKNIYIAGGYPAKATGGQSFATRDVWKYNVDTNTYTALPLLPAARGGGALELLGRELHFFGGSDSNRTDRGEHWALNLDTLGTASAVWNQRASLPNPRNHLGDATLSGKLYAIGGQRGQDANAVYQNTVHVYNPATNAWTAVESLPRGRSHIGAATFVMNGRIIVAGGEIAHGSGGTVSDVTAYKPSADPSNPAADSWTSLTPLPAARNSGVAGSIGGQLFYTTGAPGFKTTSYKGIPAN